MKSSCIYILFLLASIMCACNDDNNVSFDMDTDSMNISFKPIAGGAIMKFDTPTDPNVYSIEAKYKDFKGEEFVVLSSYLDDSLILRGFIKEENKVPVQIALLDKKGNRSSSKTYYFSTKESAANAIFDLIKVEPYWSGFRVSYSEPKESDGFLHIAYVGLNQMTKEMDTLLIESKAINRFGDIISLPGYSTNDNSTDVVIWTEDFRGNIVRKNVYKCVEAYSTIMLPQSNLKLVGNFSSEENEGVHIGHKYLFDGDKNGVKAVENQDSYIALQKQFSFISKPFAIGNDSDGWILDLGEEKVISAVRIYTQLSMLKFPMFTYWYRNMEDKLPSWVKVYVSNDMINWEEKCEFYQHNETARNDRWCYPAIDRSKAYTNASDIADAEPCFINLNFDVSTETYRYIRVQVVDVFLPNSNANTERRVTFNELEVYVKK